MNPRLKLILLTAGTITLNCLLIALLDPELQVGPINQVGVCFFLGSMFGQTTLAAAWTAFGPGPLTIRLTGSLVWIVLLALAVTINISVNSGPPTSTAVWIGLCLFGQWILLQFPLWSLAIGYGLQLRHGSDQNPEAGLRDRQFGIGQLIIVTAIVGVVLGIARAVITLLGDQLKMTDPELPLLIFLAVAAVILTLPLVLAALLKRHAPIGIALALLFTGLMTFFELPIMRSVTPGSGPQAEHFVLLNAFASLTILLTCGITHHCGFSLTRPASP